MHYWGLTKADGEDILDHIINICLVIVYIQIDY
jgi:hypothetical protein